MTFWRSHQKFWARSIYNLSFNYLTDRDMQNANYVPGIVIPNESFKEIHKCIFSYISCSKSFYLRSSERTKIIGTCISQIYNIYNLWSLKFVFICKVTCLLCELSMLPLLNHWNECLCRNPIILRVKEVTYCPKDRKVIRNKMLHSFYGRRLRWHLVGGKCLLLYRMAS